jgi:class 3 adenylate cyclase
MLAGSATESKLSIMQKITIQTAIMFADVVGSSQLYEHIGDERANQAVSQCVSMMIQEVEAQKGLVVKTIGDEVMVRFDSADQACSAAIAIQRRSHIEPDGLPVRIGIAYGHAILEQDDVFGQVVNDAAAVARIATAQQIVITQFFADNLHVHREYAVRPFDKTRLKGSQVATTIYRVDWESQEDTYEATTVVPLRALDLNEMDKALPPAIRLTHKDQLLIIKKEDTPFIVGRDNKCHLAICSNCASRDHFHIVYRRGKFVLVDHSTNGTYVQIEGSDPIYLRREELPLIESGVIALGQTVEACDEDLVRFST